MLFFVAIGVRSLAPQRTQIRALFAAVPVSQLRRATALQLSRGNRNEDRDCTLSGVEWFNTGD
jgi:hypothetical protein